jgi:hypothetical protein
MTPKDAGGNAMSHNLKRWVFAPMLVSNVYSMYGVLFWNWSVADVFFWFWCEFVLSGITSFLWILFWRNLQTDLPGGLRRAAPWIFGFTFLYMFLFATLFAAVAYKGEWKSYERLPEFFADKEIGLLATVAFYVILLVKTFAKPDRGLSESNNLTKPFNRKCFILLGFYVLFLVHGWIGEWTTGAQLNVSPAYLKGMGMALLSLKLLAELGVLDRLFPRRQPARKPG